MQSKSSFDKLDQKCIDTIRVLAADMTFKANSGHPGAPMGLAPVAYILWQKFMKFNPKNASWPDRDRFVLSNGHACALQYILNHLYGFNMSLEDLKSFRQVNSITPGHPEKTLDNQSSIEVTTGPLGQGIANAVGLAIAEKNTAAQYNRPGIDLVNNKTFCFLGDGCLMEGISSEASSLAGHLKLDNLIAFYDDNKISIDGSTNLAFTENVIQRYKAYDWEIFEVANADTDFVAIFNAIKQAIDFKGKPCMIVLRTTIGYGSVNQGKESVHGSPLKLEDIKHLKETWGFDGTATFQISDDVRSRFEEKTKIGHELEMSWNKVFDEYKSKYPKEAAEYERIIQRKLPEKWSDCLPTYSSTDKPTATRKLSEAVINQIAMKLPEFICGSADLTPSNNTRWKEAVDFQPDESKLGQYSGRYIRYGVREHAMAGIMNGIAAYGTLIPAGGTFLNFVSYASGAVRLAALSHHRVIFVATHDSIGLGEDGPTHQPIETLNHFRAMPNIMVWRPADGNEVSAAYKVSINDEKTPSIIALTRQDVPHLANSSIEKAEKGGYVLESPDNYDMILVSTGSEVSLIMEAAKILESRGIKARIVSLPCFELFDKQSKEYKLTVLPDNKPIMSVEPYATNGWEKYSHEQYGLNSWGASGPYKEVYKKFGFTKENIAQKAEEIFEYWKPVKPLYSPINRKIQNTLV